MNADPASARSARTDVCIDAIGLCTIIDGRKHETIIPRDKFDRAQPLFTQGYVSEIKLYCAHHDITASIANERSGQERLTVTRKGSAAIPGSRAHVAIAPKIPGDCLALENEVSVAVSNAHGAGYELKICQTGYQAVFEAPPDRAERSQALVFRYLGGDPAQFKTPAGRERFEALTEGIRKIEQAYGRELVQNINIIDLKGYNNALSLKGKNEIWIYADTFWGYESDELRSMASHESLHIFVDHCGFTGEPAIRELFADLMGFDPRSKERFTLLATGHLPRGYASWPKPLSPFWGFINERHFIDGMSGGHSSDNIDEFCTSFLHSLLYTENLEENLTKAISVAPRKAPRLMSSEERGRLVQLYRKAVEVFHSAAADGAGEYDPSLSGVCGLALERIDCLVRKHT